MLKKLVFAAVPLAALGGLAVAGTAHAATLTYADTSVAVNGHPVVDAITGITATPSGGTSLSNGQNEILSTPSSPALTFGATDATASTTWSVASSTGLNGFTVGFGTGSNSDALTVTGGSATSTPAGGTVTVKATNGTAAGYATVTFSAVTGHATELEVALSTDTVTLTGATDNTSGTVNFTTTPAGVPVTLGNAPTGVALSSAGVLAATHAVPGVYKSVTVTATDSGGATAVETLSIDVKGSPVKPVPAPRPHLYNGHVITVSNTGVEVGWNFGPGVNCALTRTFGYNMTDSSGNPHIGFTCYNPAENAPGTDIGYWGGLAAGHTYDIELIPAGANRQPLPDAQVGWINVVTTR